MKSYTCHFGGNNLSSAVEENNAFPLSKRERVRVVVDHFSLVAAVYFAVGVEPLLKYVHEVSHQLMEER